MAVRVYRAPVRAMPQIQNDSTGSHRAHGGRAQARRFAKDQAYDSFDESPGGTEGSERHAQKESRAGRRLNEAARRAKKEWLSEQDIDHDD